jgi:hypothetical protein
MDFEEINNKYNTEFTNKLLKNKNIFYEIYEACGNKFWTGCGSYLFDGQTYKYCDLMYEKQELLFNSVKNVKNVLEIGTYMGHSLLIMLLSNPDLKITCIDICDEFTLPAVTVLNKHFNTLYQVFHLRKNLYYILDRTKVIILDTNYEFFTKLFIYPS